MNQADWILASERLPTQKEGFPTSGLVLVVLGVTRQDVAVACYNHIDGKWKGDDYFGDYGQHVERLVTHWMPLPEPPPMLPKEFVKSLEPDFISEDTPMRALFSGVNATEKELQKTLRKTIENNGLQGVHIQTCGTKQNTFYYVDFWVHDPLELRDIKQKLNKLDVPYTISTKQKRPQ
jgi:hypothetical protein